MNELDQEFFKIAMPLLFKVMIAIVCGFIIGYDREIKHKVAGIRTNIIICVGCTILTSMGFIVADNYPSIDPTRIIGQIVTGIGFLGAGVIFKQDDKVTGMTSAAFIWLISAIGIMIGCGLVLSPIIITIVLILASHLFEKFENLIKDKK